MRRTIHLSLFLFGLSSQFLFAQSISFEGMPSGKERIIPFDTLVENTLIRLVNQFRSSKGLSVLKKVPSLSNSARYHAADMAHDDYFDHQTHDRSRSRLKRRGDEFERMDQFTKGTSIFARAENIAAGQIDAEQVMAVWKKSKGHRKNMLIKDLKYIGVAFLPSNGTKYTTYWVQNFGS